MLSAEIHLRLLDSSVRSAERLCEGQLCCLTHRRKVSNLYLLSKIYHRVNEPMYGYLNHFVAACKTRASVALGNLALVILCCRTDHIELVVSACCCGYVELAAVRRI